MHLPNYCRENSSAATDKVGFPPEVGAMLAALAALTDFHSFSLSFLLR